MQILIVEDEIKIRRLIRRGLLEESYAVDTAEDGEEALYWTLMSMIWCFLISCFPVDPATKTAKRGKHPMVLTAREYTLLEYFLRNPNTLLTKTQILEHVWDYNYDGLSNIVETYVKYLRKKLKRPPMLLN